jgi:hypothetical protein
LGSQTVTAFDAQMILLLGALLGLVACGVILIVRRG